MPTIARRAFSRALLCVSGTLLLLAPIADAQPLPIPNPIVFVKQTPVSFTFATISDLFGNFQGFYPPEAQPVGGNLFRLDPDGTLTNLTLWSNAAVRDPEVSWDASRVLFSMKLGVFGRWQVWEVRTDGSNLRRISRDDQHHDLDPAYLPDGRIVFTTDRARWSDGYENLPSSQLAIMNADGSGVRLIKRHLSGQFNPLVAADGLLYFSQWDFHDRRTSIAQNNSNFDVNRFLLWKIFADGSGFDHPHFGAHTIEDFSGGYVDVREVPGAANTFIATLADEFSTFGGGTLVRLVPQSNQDLDVATPLTPNVFGLGASNTWGRWRSPYPMADGRLLASFSAGPVFQDAIPAPHWYLVLLNGDGSGQQLLHSDPSLWSWQPVEVAPRTPPTLMPGELRDDFPYAVINSMDVTLRGRNGPLVVNGDFQPIPANGQVQQVRFFREDVRSPNHYDDFPDHADPDVAVLGTAPVLADGSFAAVVPIDTPLTWELLDGAGQVVVRERFGAELRAGELRQCRGCHTPHDGRTGRTTNLALASPTNLSGLNVDLDGSGRVDLLEFLESQLLVDGFESGNTAGWQSTVP